MDNKTYFEQHDLDEPFIASVFGVTSDTDKIHIPIKDKDGKVIFTKIRNLNSEPKFYIPEGVSAGNYLFNANAIKDEAFVVYCEGEMDCMRLAQDGIPAITAVVGGGGIPKDLSVLKEKDVYICLDSDETGKRFTGGVVEALSTIAKSIRIIELPPETKDVCEYFHSGKTVDDFNSLMSNSLSSGDWSLKQAPAEFEIERVDSLLTREMPEAKWLIKQVVPDEDFTLFTGAPATGKSFLSLTLANSLITGQKWLDKFEVCRTTSVLIIDKENGERRFKDRALGLGVNGYEGVQGNAIYRIRFPHLLSITDNRQDDKISKFAEHVGNFVQIKNIGLIIVDSLVDIMEGDENKSGDAQLFLDKFRFLFPNRAVLVLHHETKTSEKFQKPLLELARGTGNIGGQVSMGFRTSKIQGEKNVFKFEMTKARDCLEMNPIKYTMNSIVNPDDPEETIVTSLTYQGEYEEEIVKGVEIMEIIQDMLPRELDKETVVTREDLIKIGEENGIKERTVTEAISKLKKLNLINSERLPKGHPRNGKFNKTHRWFIPMNTKTFYNPRPKNESPK